MDKHKYEKLNKLEHEIEKLKAENEKLKKGQGYICDGARGAEPTNECCGDCPGCIEMQMIRWSFVRFLTK